MSCRQPAASLLPLVLVGCNAVFGLESPTLKQGTPAVSTDASSDLGNEADLSASGGSGGAPDGSSGDDKDAAALQLNPCEHSKVAHVSHDINFQVRGLTVGPDGNMWAVETQANTRATSRIVRITTRGVFTTYAIPTDHAFAQDIASGSDGNLWFTEKVAMKLGRITPNGEVTEFPLSQEGSWPRWVTPGPDGNVWFARSADVDEGDINGVLPPDDPDHGDSLGYINPTTLEIKEYPLQNDAGAESHNITNLVAGPDGQLWFTEQLYVKKMTVDGAVTAYPVPVPPFLDGNNFIGLAPGVDGNMWFTGGYADNKFGWMSSNGNFLGEIELPPWRDNGNTGSTLPMGITQASDGHMYFIEYLSSRIGRVDYPNLPAFTEFSLDAQKKPAEIVEGPDHNIWVSEFGGVACLGLH